MCTSYYAGQALPGMEIRSDALDQFALNRLTGERLMSGTFNVSLMESPRLGPSKLTVGQYHLWPCKVAITGMVEREEAGIPGWVLRIDGEHLPDNFVEIISAQHLRTALKKVNWPAFAVEVALKCEEPE